MIDPNYLITPDGKMHYLFGKKKGEEGSIRVHAKHNISVTTTKPTPQPAVTQKKKRKRKPRYGSEIDDDIDDDDGNTDDLYNVDESGTYSCKVSWKTTKRTRGKAEGNPEEEIRNANPLPGFLDPITLDEVAKPAISPYGHVMG